MNDFQHYLVEEFAEDYAEGRLSRREAFKLIASITGSILAADLVLAARSSPLQGAKGAQSLTPPQSSDPGTSPASALTPDDAPIHGERIEFVGEGAALFGYLARPQGEGANPVILVCHENRGLTAHMQDVSRRLARAGYVALAVDLLSRRSGSEALSPDQVPGALGNMPPEQFVQEFLSCWRYLQGQDFARADRVGMVGFCFGGSVTRRVATAMPELLAAVPFYAPHPPVEDVPKIQAAVLAIYAERDQRINQGIPVIEQAMRAHKKIFEKVIDADTDHAFHNDTGPRYNSQAARTLGSTLWDGSTDLSKETENDWEGYPDLRRELYSTIRDRSKLATISGSQ